MNNVYPADAYDKDLCLKVSLPMWLVILYLLRPYVILIVSLLDIRNRGEIFSMIYGDHRLLPILAALAGLPALAVVYAWSKRRVEASDRIRWIWSNGRHFLVGSAMLNIIGQTVPALLGVSWRIGALAWSQIAVSAMAILYLLVSKRVRDTFRDFPEEIEEPVRSGRSALRGGINKH